MLNLVHVNAFLAVMEGGGFHEAARRLGIGQSTVTEHVRQLERALGQVLIERHRTGCVPTRAGSTFAPYARSLIATAAGAKARVSGARVALGASGNIGVYLMPAYLKRLAACDQLPGEIDLTIAPNPEIAERLCQGELDLAAMEWWDDRPGFTAIPWRRERLVVIVAADHEWAARSAISAEELRGVRLLGGERGSGTGTLLRQALGPLADELTLGRNLGSTEAVKQAVKAGLGVSLVSHSAVVEELQHGTLVALTLRGREIAKHLKLVLPNNLPEVAPARRVARALTA